MDCQAQGRRKCVTAYEKGIIWGNDNYRTIGALVNIALATGNIGREGGGVCRLGGHQEGYMRPSDAHVGRPAPYIDQLLIAGKGKVHHIWANDHYKTTLNASVFKREYILLLPERIEAGDEDGAIRSVCWVAQSEGKVE